jgi:hypothetical protein
MPPRLLLHRQLETADSSFAGVEDAIGILAEPKRSPDRGQRSYATPAWRYQFIRCC